MDDSTIIRPATADDVAALVMLLERSWRDNWAPHVSVASRARFDAERPALGYAEQCWADIEVAVRTDRIVGMVHREGDYLHAIHVAGDSWGAGIGSTLMGHVEAAGARRLEVRAFNQRAIAFYLRRGWLEAGREADTEMGTPCQTVMMALAAGG